MKISEFNNWPLTKKEEYIKTFISGNPLKPGTLVGALIFEYWSIIVVYSLNGKLISADVEAHGQRGIIDARKLLNGRRWAVIDGNVLPEVKAETTKKIYSATNRNN